MGSLKGLKAEALTTEAKPRLRLVFLPRFWGSYESRWELGKTHLVPLIMHGWDRADHTLCGIRAGAAKDEGELADAEPLPKWLCKRCQQGAGRRGFGK